MPVLREGLPVRRAAVPGGLAEDAQVRCVHRAPRGRRVAGVRGGVSHARFGIRADRRAARRASRHGRRDRRAARSIADDAVGGNPAEGSHAGEGPGAGHPVARSTIRQSLGGGAPSLPLPRLASREERSWTIRWNCCSAIGGFSTPF